jgi:hypothetical protein
MAEKIKDNSIHVAESDWNEFEKIVKFSRVLYDANVSKLYKNYTQVDFYSKNDYIKVKTLLNRRNIPYKDQFNETLRNYIKRIVQEYYHS